MQSLRNPEINIAAIIHKQDSIKAIVCKIGHVQLALYKSTQKLYLQTMVYVYI